MILGRLRRLAQRGIAVSRGSILAGGGGAAYLIAAAVLNASNFVFNVIASRLLGPSAFGALGSLLGLVSVVTIVLGALTVAVARTVSAEAEQPQPGDLAPSRTAILLTVLGFALVLALAVPLRNLLHLTSVWPVVIMSFVLPLAVAEIVPRGALLARLNFRTLSLAVAASAVTRLGAGVILIELGMGLNGAVLATVLSQLVVTALIVWPVRHELRRVPETTPIKVPLSDATLALIALGGFSALNAVDSVLARYYLPAVQSGYYVAASTAAQIAFALPVTIALMAYPRFVAVEKDGDGHKVLIEGIALVGTLGFVAAAILWRFHIIVTVLFGKHYAPAAAALRVLAWEGMALGLMSVFVYFHLGHRKLMSCASWLGVAGAIVLVAGVFHDGQLPIAFVMLSVSTVVLLAMAMQAFLELKGLAQSPFSHPSRRTEGVTRLGVFLGDDQRKPADRRCRPDRWTLGRRGRHVGQWRLRPEPPGRPFRGARPAQSPPLRWRRYRVSCHHLLVGSWRWPRPFAGCRGHLFVAAEHAYRRLRGQGYAKHRRHKLTRAGKTSRTTPEIRELGSQGFNYCPERVRGRIGCTSSGLFGLSVAFTCLYSGGPSG